MNKQRFHLLPLAASPGLALLLLGALTLPAQTPGNSPIDGLPRWLESQSKVEARRADTARYIEELERQLAADPHEALQRDVAELSTFIAELNDVRTRAERWVDPGSLLAFEFPLSAANSHLETLTRDLTAKQESLEANRQFLRQRIEEERRELVMTSKLLSKIDETIRTLRQDRLREAKTAEIKTMLETPNPIATPIGQPVLFGVVPGLVRPPAATSPDKSLQTVKPAARNEEKKENR